MGQERENLTGEKLIRELSFCVFDLETTGGNHQVDKVIEIGLIQIKNLKIVKEINYLINPEIPIPEFIQKLTNIREEDVKHSPTIDEVIEEILEFMGDSILVAHNTSFDIPFFNSVLRRLGKKELENKAICTNLMTKYLIPNLLNSNLNYMSKVFGIPHHKAHRALDDAKAAANLLIEYLEIFIEKGISKINHLYYPRNRFELDRNNFKKGTPLLKITTCLQKIKTPFLITLKGANGVILFSLPCKNLDKEKIYIEEKISEHDWEMITIKLYGPFLEVFIHYNTLFNKIDEKQRIEISEFLWKTHLPKKTIDETNASTKKVDQVPLELDSQNIGDFVICSHLVPEQYIILPLKSLHIKSQLIFRYPAHKKKLIQNISSKGNKLAQKKLKQVYFNPLLKSFLKHFIENEKKAGNGDMLFFSFPKDKNYNTVLEKIEEYIDSTSNHYYFPKEYI